jgi:hypothetical protein
MVFSFKQVTAGHGVAMQCWAWQCNVWHGIFYFQNLSQFDGTAKHGFASRGTGMAMQFLVFFSISSPGTARQGDAVPGMAMLGAAGRGRYQGNVWLGQAWRSSVWRGRAMLGVAWNINWR